MKQVAVITGGAGGLGQALCSALVGEGWHVVVLDLPSETLDGMAGESVTALAVDLTDESAVRTCCAQIIDAHEAIDLAVYNAGVTHIGAFCDSDIAVHRRVFDINFFGAILVAKELLGAVRKAKGVHLAISSVAGFTPLFKRTAYSASKHALEGFFNSLRSEEEPFGVTCLIAAPSFVATNPGNPDVKDDQTARPGSATDGFSEMSAQQAVAIILDGYKKRRLMTPVGRVAKLAWWINRLSPAFYERQMIKKMRG